ncbi:MAG TPA: hypothetical protein VJ872_10065 [Nocardioides sp.]|nr:hypothetical protein [Nocardioides sp.]
MGTRIRRTALTLAAAVMLAAAVTRPATAATWAHADAAGDVIYGTPPDLVPVAAPEDARDDIVRFRVAHLARQVAVRLTLRGLPRPSRFLQVAVTTPAHRYVVSSQGASAEVLRVDGGPRVVCHIPPATLDSAHLRLQLVVPRTCLGRPRWVRVGAQLVNERTVDGALRVYRDDALRTGIGRTLALSPRIARG